MIIKPGDFDDPQVRELLRQHLQDMADTSPPGHSFALDLSGLQQPDITFLSVWDGDTLLAIGAMKQLAADHGELKSMRTRKDSLRRGAATAMLNALLDLARARGYRRVSSRQAQARPSSQHLRSIASMASKMVTPSPIMLVARSTSSSIWTSPEHPQKRVFRTGTNCLIIRGIFAPLSMTRNIIAEDYLKEVRPMSAVSRHIVVLGAGFAALTAVRTLRKADPDVRITLVAPSPEFHYLPSLIWVPTGLRKPEELVHRLDGFFARQRVTYHAGRVTSLKDGGRTVLTDTGEIANDGLIIATGGRFLKKLPGIEHVLTICEGIGAAEAIRNRLEALQSGRIALGFATNPQEQGAMRGGPMFEMLFGIDTWLRKQGRRDRVALTFFNPSPRPGQRLGAKAVDGLLAEMKRRNIDKHLGHKLKASARQASKRRATPSRQTSLSSCRG